MPEEDRENRQVAELAFCWPFCRTLDVHCTLSLAISQSHRTIEYHDSRVLFNPKDWIQGYAAHET